MAALSARTLKIEVEGDEYTAEVFTAQVNSGETDNDEVTYAEAAAGGGREYVLALTMTQDMANTSLWYQVFSAAGTDVDITLMPYGNTTPTATQPHFTMTANVREPDGALIGGEADSSTTARQKIEVEWPLTAKPTRVTA
jgi:hypothetical protein